MNAHLNAQGTKTRGPKLFCFRLAVVLASLSLGAALLLPAMKSRAAHHHPMPSGQFRADVRTFIAGVHYLFESEPDIKTAPAPFDGSPVVFAQRAPGRAFVMSDSSTNQTEPLSGSSTNLPVQI
jgi:hypothetical protein